MADPPIGLSKRSLRRSLQRLLDGREWQVLTTSNGAVDGSTFVAAGYAGQQLDSMRYWWALWDDVDTGDDDTALGEYRQIATNDGGTFTLFQAFSQQVLDAASLELLPLMPPQYTEAINEALTEL